MIRSYKGISPMIHETCYVDETAQIIGDVTLGEHSSVWMNAVVRGDVHHIRIGANSNIQDNCVLHGMLNQWPVEIGDWVTVGHNVTLHGCVVGDRCLIGMGAIILNEAVIGEDSIVGAGALVTQGKAFPPRSMILGSPAKAVRPLTDAEVAGLKAHAEAYVELARRTASGCREM